MLTFTLWLQPTRHLRFCINSHEFLLIIIWNFIHLFITNTCILLSIKWNYFQQYEIIKTTHCGIFISINYHPSDLTKIQLHHQTNCNLSFFLFRSFFLWCCSFQPSCHLFSISQWHVPYVTHLHNHSSTLTFSWTNKPKFVSWH